MQGKRPRYCMKDEELKNIIQEHKDHNSPPQGRDDLNEIIFQKIQEEKVAISPYMRSIMTLSVFLILLFSVKIYEILNVSENAQITDTNESIDILLDDFYEEEEHQFEVAIANDFISLLDEV